MGSLIHSAHTGIAILAGSIIGGEIYNDGQIKATGNGIFIGDGSLTITGTISNAGTIDVPLAGIEIANVPSFNAALQNGGTISAQTGLLVQDVSTFADNIDNELGAVVSQVIQACILMPSALLPKISIITARSRRAIRACG